MSERDEKLDLAVEILKEPVSLDPSFDRRVMAEIESAPPPRAWVRPIWAGIDWMRRGRPVSVSPLGGLAMAAGLAALLLIGRSWLEPGEPAPMTMTAGAAQASVVQFVIVVPTASTVSLVGDFNDWSNVATPMDRDAGNGVWSITVPLDPGRYRYAFLVDETTWLSDPSAPPVLDDEFGRPGSVVTIGEL